MSNLDVAKLQRVKNSSCIAYILSHASDMAGRPVDQSHRPFQGPWEGESKIVIGIDIGTTQSGVAFAFLQQGLASM